MLPKTDTYTEKQIVDLFGNTGIQFLDLGLALDLRREPAGQFAVLNDGLLVRLFEDKDGNPCYESDAGEALRARPARGLDDIRMQASLELLEGIWLPAPFFRYFSDARFDEGPNNWARLRITRLETPDVDGNTHRITLAFDTNVMPRREGVAYLAPNDDDLTKGQLFRLAVHVHETKYFLDMHWVKDWLKQVFTQRCEEAGRDTDEMKQEIEQSHFIAHYLNLLSLLRGPAPISYPRLEPKVAVPAIRLKWHEAVGAGDPIPVDLVLDIGNSRCCGILVEDSEQNNRGLYSNTHLVLRDMSAPEHVYDHPFESRVEFAKIDLGDEQCSMQSGRHDAFTWATMARVGTEAAKLAALRAGTEGATGLSSPKRYLWDTEPYDLVWRLNNATLKGQQEPMAMLRPLADLIDDRGEALADVMDEAVFEPRYARASLMTMMLNEVFAQAVAQINSILYRRDKENANTARWLRTVILTVPPSMPQVERTEFRKRVEQALSLLWKSMGWHEGEYYDDPFEKNERHSGPAWHQTPEPAKGPKLPRLPKVILKWDEATCAQMVYLYTEVGENFGGHPEEFFDALARAGKPERECITVASIDIGGGTTDLVINNYTLERQGAGGGSNATIIPKQCFRDGFRVAGDDIVLDVIRLFVLPSFERALELAGVPSPADEADKICGARGLGASDSVLRQQLTLQAFYPLALALLSEYERYDPEEICEIQTRSWAQWLGDGMLISDSVTAFVARVISAAKNAKTDFSLKDIELSFNPAELHQQFLLGVVGGMNISKTLTSLAEVVAHYDCDVLLLTGRPSRLPGVQALIRSLACVPPGRILPMQNYRSGNWFPFHKAGLIDDPKTTASVGAMVCWLAENRRLPNFYCSPSRLRPLPLIRYFGRIDANNLIKQDDVLFSEIETYIPDGQPPEEACIKLPRVEGDVAQYALNGDARLGYRQLASPRWPAAPIYMLGFEQGWLGKYREKQRTNPNMPDPRILVSFTEKNNKANGRQGLISDELVVDTVEGAAKADGSGVVEGVNKNAIYFKMNTLLHTGLGQDSYWLDSGSVKV